MAMADVTVVDHPLVQHKLTLMRSKETSTSKFRRLLHEIGTLLGYEALRDLPLENIIISTPVCETTAPRIAGKKLCLISILRAGDGLLPPMLELVPSARIGQVGLQRDETTLKPVKFFFKIPSAIQERLVVLLDPMLATGGSAIVAVDELKKAGAINMRFVCLLAAPEGIAAFQTAHPDVPIITASIDERLNECGYIIPGLGDAGDRLFGTKD